MENHTTDSCEILLIYTSNTKSSEINDKNNPNESPSRVDIHNKSDELTDDQIQIAFFKRLLVFLQ